MSSDNTRPLLDFPIMNLMLTVLALAALLLSNSNPTYGKTVVNLKEDTSHDERDPDPEACANIPNMLKIDCFPVGAASQEACLKRNCCWTPVQADSSSKANIPWCYYPRRRGGYVSDPPVKTKTGFKMTMHRKIQSPYDNDIETIQMDVRMETPTRLRVRVQLSSICSSVLLSVHIRGLKLFFFFQITDPKTKRFEPPYPKVPTFDGPVAPSPLYTVQTKPGASGFNVLRKASNQTM